MKVYRIKNWESIYENNRSRGVKDLAWVAIPNRHDGEGYSLIMAHPKASEVFTAWILMLQVASRCHPRGSLLRDNGRPHSPQTLALKTRAKTEWFALASQVLSSDEIGWMECVEMPEKPNDAPGRHEGDTLLPASCQAGDEEQNRTEGNGTGQKVVSAQPPAAEPPPNPRPRFERPTLDQLKLHASRIGLPESEAEKFFNYYEANGWKVGRNPMKSWQAGLVYWRTKWQERNGSKVPERNQTQEHLEIPRL